MKKILIGKIVVLSIIGILALVVLCQPAAAEGTITGKVISIVDNGDGSYTVGIDIDGDGVADYYLKVYDGDELNLLYLAWQNGWSVRITFGGGWILDVEILPPDVVFTEIKHIETNTGQNNNQLKE